MTNREQQLCETFRLVQRLVETNPSPDKRAADDILEAVLDLRTELKFIRPSRPAVMCFLSAASELQKTAARITSEIPAFLYARKCINNFPTVAKLRKASRANVKRRRPYKGRRDIHGRLAHLAAQPINLATKKALGI
jgi:hypothetical protein